MTDQLHPTPVTVIPRNVAPLSKLALEHGWLVGDVVQAVGPWLDKDHHDSTERLVTFLPFHHPDRLERVCATWVDNKWHGAHGGRLTYYPTATALKAFLIGPTSPRPTMRPYWHGSLPEKPTND